MSLRADVASAYRPVTYSQLTPSSTSDRIDQHLHDASGYTAEAGAKGKVADWLDFDLTLYHLFYGDRVGTMMLQNEDGTFYRYQTNLGNSVHDGIEAYFEACPFASSASEVRSLRFFSAVGITRARYQDYNYTKEVSGQLQEISLTGNRVEYAPQEVIRFGASWS
ncbi:MAG: TonB-dependent receptor domain-containing protein, partial [Flavobacteriales bacterium]